jgi:hypothetical protein
VLVQVELLLGALLNATLRNITQAGSTLGRSSSSSSSSRPPGSWPSCDGPAYTAARDVIWKIALGCVIFSIANLVNAVMANMLSSRFYRWVAGGRGRAAGLACALAPAAPGAVIHLQAASWPPHCRNAHVSKVWEAIKREHYLKVMARFDFKHGLPPV